MNDELELNQSLGNNDFAGTDKLKILIINDYIEVIGGVEIYIYNIKNLLENRGHKVKIVGGIKRNNAVIQFISSFFSLKYKFIIANEIEKFKPNLIFAHSIGDNISPSFLSAAAKANIPVVLTVPYLSQFSTLSNVNNMSDRMLTKLRKSFHKILVKKYVAVFIAPSRCMESLLRYELGVKNIKQIPNPFFWNAKDDVSNMSSNPPRILFVGRLENAKGILCLLRAFSIVSKNLADGNVFLDIVGEGDCRNKLIDLAKREHISEKVNFLGQIPHEMLVEKYAQAKIFVLPSTIEENAPLTILEALSQGVPVITTNLGGQMELVLDNYNGFCVSPSNFEQLADKILLLIKDESLWKEMSKNAINFSKQFLQENHVLEIEKLFNDLSKNYK